MFLGFRSGRHEPILRFVVWVGSVAAVAAGLVRVARADGLADEAELHFQIATERYRAGDYRGALEHFFVSNRLAPNRNVVFNIGRTYEQLQRYPEAYRYYLEALEGENDPATRRSLEGAIARIAPHVAVLRVETTPPGATIYIDRRDLGSRGTSPRVLAFPAGRYRVIVEKEGYEPAVSEVIDAQVGRETVVRLVLRRIVGSVRVEGMAGAVLRIDDERTEPVCTVPCSTEVSPGPHTLFVSREGYQTLVRQVFVTERRTVTVRAELVPLTGSLVVSTEERDALVEIDGRSMGFTPVAIPHVPVGRRRVRVSLRGYRPVEREVDIRPNQQTELLDLPLLPVREVTAASRTTESLEDAPSSVTLIDGREIQAFGYPTIAEALRGVRGVYLSNDRTYVSAGIRGLGEPNDYGNRMLVLSDGQSLNDNIVNSSYIGSDGRADLHDVERIEVVRGPGSLLYGTGAFSGVVNLVLRGRDAPPGVHVSAGTYDDGVTRARAGFHVNFGRDAGVWASVSGARSDGRDVPIEVIDAMGQRQRVIVNHADAFWSSGTAGRAWWGPLTAQWFVHTREQYIPVGAFGAVLNDPRTVFVDTRMMSELRYEPRLSRTVQLMLRAHANRYTFYDNVQYTDTVQRESYYGTWFGLESRLVFTPLSQLRITAGGEVQLHPEATMEGLSIDTMGRQTRYMNERRPYQLGAGYALVESSPTSWFRISAGARLDVYSTFGPTLNPRVALIFRPRSDGTLKIMAGRAFRAPSIYELYYNDGGVTQVSAVSEGRTLGPEVIYSGEVEYAHRFAHDWVALGAVHASRVEGIINTIPDAPMSEVIRYANSTSPVLLAGGDIEIRREWRQGWMFSAMYSYQRAQYLDTNTYPDPRLINAPEHMASFKTVVPIVQGVVSVAARAALEAPRRISMESREELVMRGLDPDNQTRPAIVADLVLSGTVQRYGLRYALGLYNLLDWRYEVPISSVYASRTMVQNGRTLLFDVRVNF